MPHYSYEKTFTAGTDRASEEELEMLCHWGILCEVVISFPWGAMRQCHVHIDDGLHQVFPTNPEEAYAFNGFNLDIEDEYEIEQGVSKLYLRGWNEGSYDHTIRVAFRIRLPERLSRTDQLLEKILGMWERLLG